MNNNALKVKACLITGAAGGIGRALVQEFHNAGYKIIATDKGEAPVDLPYVYWISADLEQFVEQQEYASKVIQKINTVLDDASLHVLINNAAIQILGGADNLTRTDWQKTISVNLLAPFFLSQALLEPIERAAGCIVNIGSIHARLTKKSFVAYATSKAALAGMTRSLAVDLGNRVRVNAIEPAAISTEMLQAGFTDQLEMYERLANSHPLQRIGQPEEVARLALAIVAGGMNFMQGTCVGLDGGVSGLLNDPC